MIVKTITSKNIIDEKTRLDCSPYMTAAFEARAAIVKLNIKKQSLGDISSLYKGKQLKRIFVDKDNGVGFLNTSNMLHMHLFNLPYLSSEIANTDKKCLVKKRDILVSAAGSIGRMSYISGDMEDLFACGDIIKVTIDESKVLPGYVYALMNGKFGKPIIQMGTYGSIIQHLDVKDLARFSVPIVSKHIEGQVNELMEKSIKLYEDSSKLLSDLVRRIDAPYHEELASDAKYTVIKSTDLLKRFDVTFHDPRVEILKRAIKNNRHMTIGDFCDSTFLPGIFKRIHIDDINYGAEYYTGASLFCKEPEAKGILSKTTSKYEDVLLKYGTVLVQAFGQKGGLTGRPVWVGRNLNNKTTTHMLVRLYANDSVKAAFLYAFLLSDTSYKQVAALTYGGSIPHFDENIIKDVLIPFELGSKEIEMIGEISLKALEMRDNAQLYERQAIKMVEDAIEAAAPKH